MSHVLGSIAELEACVGTPPLGVKMKIIDHLDAEAVRWIGASRLAFVGAGSAHGPKVCVAGGELGFASVKDAQTLMLPRETLDDPDLLAVGMGAGVLFLASGIGETLRANGRVAAVSETHVEIGIEECFVHCAKALIRSDFWKATPTSSPADAAGFVNATRFLALATMDSAGRIDISPKGDPAGLLMRLQGERATLAERPGNKLAFGYRNIIETQAVAALAVIPGAPTVATMQGRASLSTDEALRASFVVAEKTPLLCTVIDDVKVTLSTSKAFARAEAWSAETKPADLDPAEVLVAHVKLNKEHGVPATLLRLAVNRGLVDQGLRQNYKTQLY